ncbi:MAG: hypothetical protein ACLP2P_13015 [Desulfobaccales bacterium]
MQKKKSMSKQKITRNTNLYPIIFKFINDEWEKLNRKQIIPWSFLTTSSGLSCKDFYGKEIHYAGKFKFEGSPREVFWNRYIEPFLEDISYRAIDYIINICKEREERINEPLLEAEMQLKSLIRKAYTSMADVDRRLRGCGYPQNVAIRKVESEIAVMDRFVVDRIQSENSMYKAPSKSIKFYRKHPYLFWFIGIFLGLLSVILGIWQIWKMINSPM